MAKQSSSDQPESSPSSETRSTPKRDSKSESKSESKSDSKSDSKRNPKEAKPFAALSAPEASRATERGGQGAVLSWGEGAGLAVVALIVGGVAGWYGRGVHSGADSASVPAPSSVVALPLGSAGPGQPPLAPECQQWSEAICKGAGAESEGCEQAKTAANLMSADACRASVATVPATLERLKQARSACDQLVERLCKDIGPETDSCKMVRERTPGFPTSRCTQLMGQYDDVLGELKQMEQQNAPLSAEQVARQVAGDVPSTGPKDAKVAVVLYSDFQCPYCAGATETLEKIREKYGSRVRIIFRNFPLSFHAKAGLAAEAALAAHAQGKFWPFHDLLFANQEKLDRADLEGYAQQVGLDMAAFRKALDDHSTKAQVDADMKLGEEIGVGGTPTMIVGTGRAADPRDFEAVAALIDKQLAGS